MAGRTLPAAADGLVRWLWPLVIALLLVYSRGLPPNANFHYHMIDLFRNTHRDDDRATVPQVEQLRGALDLIANATAEPAP